MLHVAEDATRVIELGPILGGESRDADLMAAYHAFGDRFDCGVYEQRGATAPEDFVRRLLNPGECCGVLISGLDLGGVLRRANETEWRVIGRDCVDHPLDAAICTALDLNRARVVLDFDWTTADAPQDNWTGNTQMRLDNLVKVMPRADDALRLSEVVFARFRAALADDDADAASILGSCWDTLKQGCETMGAERFMAEVRAEFQAKHADDIARELLRPREVEIMSVNIHDAKAEPERRVVSVERRGLGHLRDALAARLAAREAQPRDAPASAFEGRLEAKLAGLPSELLVSVAEAADQKLDGDARPRMRPQPPQRAFDTDLVFACVEVKYTKLTG